MAMLDDRGRVFGRVNLLDLAVGLLVFLLIPMAYASWMLFRTPVPVIQSVTPSVIPPGMADQHIDVRGQYLRPFLRANIGSARATYLFESPDHAQVQLPALAPGTYDVSFFDSKEIARFPNAVTVRPGTTVEIRVRFVTRPEVLQEVQRTERDGSKTPPPDASRPTLVSHKVTDELLGTTKSDLSEGRLSVIEGVVRLPAIWTADGWQSDGVPLKAGAPFKLTAPTYVLEGEILSIAAPDGPR